MSLLEVQHSLRKADQALYNAVKSERKWELWEKAMISGFAMSEVVAFSEHVSSDRPSSYFPWMVGGIVSLLGSVVADYKKDIAQATQHTKEKEIKNLTWQKRQELHTKLDSMTENFYTPNYVDIIAEDFSEEDGGIQKDIFDESEYKVLVLKEEPKR